MAANKNKTVPRAPQEETYDGPAECQDCPFAGAACETCKVLADFDAAADNPQSAPGAPGRNPQLDPGPLSRRAIAAAARACRLLLEFNDLDPKRTGDRLEMSRRIVLLADAISAAREAVTGETDHCGLYERARAEGQPGLAECAGGGHHECSSCVHHLCCAKPVPFTRRRHSGFGAVGDFPNAKRKGLAHGSDQQ